VKTDKGIVLWVTGLPGSGKTTVATELHQRFLERGRHFVMLDGDILREVFGGDLGYDLESRRKSAARNSRLCKVLSDQGVNVICATISLFHETHKWNRAQMEKYFEIYLNVSKETLHARDQKKLFSSGQSGQTKNVMGLDLPFEEPLEPNMKIDNNGSETSRSIAERIISRMEEIYEAR
jgi:adenylylsulfate kinase